MPSERGVQLELQLCQQHRKGGYYFIDSAAIHGIATQTEVVTMIIRSKCQSVGFSDTYAMARPGWSSKKRWSPEDTKETQVRLRADWGERVRGSEGERVRG